MTIVVFLISHESVKICFQHGMKLHGSNEGMTRRSSTNLMLSDRKCQGEPPFFLVVLEVSEGTHHRRAAHIIVAEMDQVHD